MTEPDAVWSALSHPARRRIVDALREGPLTTGRVHDALGDLSPSRFATQRHLQVLRDADVVLVTERGRERANGLNASALYQATVGWLDPASARTAHSLDSLKRLAESPGTKGPTMQEFHVTQAIDIEAEPERVWRALVEQPSDWWGAPYLLLDGTSALELPTVAGAPVTERLGDASALWGVVTECSPGSAYAWAGQMGMGPAATGEVRYRLEPTATGTRVTVQHDWVQLWGEGSRASYDYGWADLNARLKLLVETGERCGVAGSNSEPTFAFTPSS